MSYYKGKLYLYFGVTPALVLFWPYAALTGHYLLHKNAVVIFFAVGFLVAAGLLRAVWRRYFPEASVWVVVAGILTLGLATGILETLSSCDVYEVAKSCGFAFTMLALAAIWRALHEPKRQVVWLLLASLAYGLAIGSRPSLLFGAIILLLPVVQAWRAATEPGFTSAVGIVVGGGGRSGDADWVGADALQHPALRQPIRIWLALSVDQLPAEYRSSIQPALPLVQLSVLFFGTHAMGRPFPLFANCPSAAFAIGLLGRGRTLQRDTDQLSAGVAGLGRAAGMERTAGAEISVLRWFVAAVFLLFVICALTLCLFFSASSRYELDFLPALMLLAVIGILGLEQCPGGFSGLAAHRPLELVPAAGLYGWIQHIGECRNPCSRQLHGRQFSCSIKGGWTRRLNVFKRPWHLSRNPRSSHVGLGQCLLQKRAGG